MEAAVETADRLVELIASGVSIEIAPLSDGVLVRLSGPGRGHRHVAASGQVDLLTSLRNATSQFEELSRQAAKSAAGKTT